MSDTQTADSVEEVVAKGVERVNADETPSPPAGAVQRQEEEDVFEDASEDGEVQIRREAVHPRPLHPDPVYPPRAQVGNRLKLKPDTYDGTSDWTEYVIYFDQVAELNGWDEETKAMTLGVCLRGEARMVLAGLNPAQRRSYGAVTRALEQSFSPVEKVHLYQAELKARRKKTDETMADLGRDVAKLVRLAYPTADPATREVIGINSFLDALPGPASEIKLHVIKGRPRTLQEATAHATEVEAVMEADSRRTQKRRGEGRHEVKMVGTEEGDKMKQLERRCEELEKSLKRSQASSGKRKDGRKPVVCYECKEEGHYKRDCPKVRNAGKQNQGNVSPRLDQRE